MPWGPGQSVTTAAIATDLGYLFIFGSTDSGKNLVTGTTFTATLNGAAAYGSDSIGTYVENVSSYGRLEISTSTATNFSATNYSYFVTFSREGTPGNFAALSQWLQNDGSTVIGLIREGTGSTTRFYYPNNYILLSVDVAAPTISTEYTYCVVVAGTSIKVFRTGGSSATSGTISPVAFTSGIGNLQIAGTLGFGNVWYPGRFRAFGRWARALSDTEAQSMADNPQQIVAAAAPTIYEFQSLNRGVGRGIARGIA